MDKECEKKKETICLKCTTSIDLNNDLFVCLGTYQGDRTVKEDYFHMRCWRDYFEERARQKAEVIVNGMQEKMMPIAKQLIGKLTGAIKERSEDDDGGQVVTV